MKYVSLAFLAAFSVWALSVVSRDMATRKIPNASLKTGAKLLAAGAAGMLLYTWLGYTGHESSFLNAGYYLYLVRHLVWSFLAGVALWYAEVWPAGDAKFFIVVAAALPLANPFLRNFPDYLFLSLLINIFVSAALWVLGSFIASGFYSASPAEFFAEVWRDVKERFSGLGTNGAAASLLLLNMGFVFLLQQVLSLEARSFIGRFIARTDMLFFFMFILWDKIGPYFSGRRWAIASAAGYGLYFALGALFFREHLWLMAGAALKNVVRFSLLLFLGRFMLEFLMEKKDSRFVGPGELEPGTILSEKAARMARQNVAFEGLFDDCFKDGLTQEQVQALRAWMGKLASPDPKIEVVAGRPFALWIFAGAALTLVLNRNLAGLLK